MRGGDGDVSTVKLAIEMEKTLLLTNIFTRSRVHYSTNTSLFLFLFGFKHPAHTL